MARRKHATNRGGGNRLSPEGAAWLFSADLSAVGYGWATSNRPRCDRSPSSCSRW